jgi:hypothetical protein
MFVKSKVGGELPERHCQIGTYSQLVMITFSACETKCGRHSHTKVASKAVRYEEIARRHCWV